MDFKLLIKDYLHTCHMMQLATLRGDQPWCCTVYYIVDDELNLYWASRPMRRHSREIYGHDKVAAAIPVKHVIGEKVVGLQIEGSAHMVTDQGEIRPIAQKYAVKFGRNQQTWVDEFSDGKTDHKLYRLTPSLIVLFDEQNFSGAEARQEWRLVS